MLYNCSIPSIKNKKMKQIYIYTLDIVGAIKIYINLKKWIFVYFSREFLQFMKVEKKNTFFEDHSLRTEIPM